MAKVRLHLGKIGQTTYGYGSDETILCKKIHTIIIDGKTYRKNDCGNDSMKIQNLYRFIIKNVDKISYIKHGTFVDDTFSNYVELYLENNKLHYCGGFAKALINDKNVVGNYYIDGVKLEEKEFLIHPKRKIWLRENKLKRILQNV
jgi:hypothetical protein